jgi:hypothetical protein
VRSDGNDIPQSRAVETVRETLGAGGGVRVGTGILSSSPGRGGGIGVERERRKSVKFVATDERREFLRAGGWSAWLDSGRCILVDLCIGGVSRPYNGQIALPPGGGHSDVSFYALAGAVVLIPHNPFLLFSILFFLYFPCHSFLFIPL